MEPQRPKNEPSPPPSAIGPNESNQERNLTPSSRSTSSIFSNSASVRMGRIRFSEYPLRNRLPFRTVRDATISGSRAANHRIFITRPRGKPDLLSDVDRRTDEIWLQGLSPILAQIDDMPSLRTLVRHVSAQLLREDNLSGSLSSESSFVGYFDRKLVCNASHLLRSTTSSETPKALLRESPQGRPPSQALQIRQDFRSQIG